MVKLEVVKGPQKGLRGEAFFYQKKNLYLAYFPSASKPRLVDYFSPKLVRIIGELSAKRARSILEKKEFRTLQRGANEVQMIGCKCCCSSVWCKSCYVRKGGAKRFAKRLAVMNFKAVRQVVLTVDLKKFSGDGQQAYEYLKEKKAVVQFIHDLRRTGKVPVNDWAWVLEWHTDGAPHWHLFIMTVPGREGQIGNERLLRHWDYGLVFESYIKSEKHWKRFTDYFAGNGYFNPKQGSEAKDKSHQLELPEWAKQVTYKIRKTGSMVRKKDESESQGNKSSSDANGSLSRSSEASKTDKAPRTYTEVLESCGQATLCRLYKGCDGKVWRKINIPYRQFKEFPGEYIKGVGYYIRMAFDDFLLFRALYDNDLSASYNESAFA